MVNIKIKLKGFCTIVILWIAISNGIQAFKCPEMTETQLFLHLYKSFILDFQSC